MLAKSFQVARHFARNITHTKRVNKPYFTHKSQTNLDKYIRDYEDKPERLHPDTKKRYMRATEPLGELKYKLHSVGEEDKRLDYLTPLGVTQEIPWRVVRTSSENLPVYRRYTHGRTMNYTEIRLIEGDIQVNHGYGRISAKRSRKLLAMPKSQPLLAK